MATTLFLPTEKPWSWSMLQKCFVIIVTVIPNILLISKFVLPHLQKSYKKLIFNRYGWINSIIIVRFICSSSQTLQYHTEFFITFLLQCLSLNRHISSVCFCTLWWHSLWLGWNIHLGWFWNTQNCIDWLLEWTFTFLLWYPIYLISLSVSRYPGQAIAYQRTEAVPD